MNTYSTLGGRVTCVQCTATSKSTGQQCRAPAKKGKTKCHYHGGTFTGPKTEAGRLRCADAKTVHGNERRKTRSERSVAMRELWELEAVGHALGFMTGPLTPGRKPKTPKGA